MQCDIVNRLFMRFDALAKTYRTARDYGAGQPLYQSEIDLLEAIYKSENQNVSRLSERLGVTKSAVTQIASKLLKKGLIERIPAKTNKKERFFQLTSVGMDACIGYERHYQSENQKMRAYLCKLSEQEKSVILNFFNQIDDVGSISTSVCTCAASCSSPFCQLNSQSLHYAQIHKHPTSHLDIKNRGESC